MKMENGTNDRLLGDEQELDDEIKNDTALFDGDKGALPIELRKVLVSLLRGPYLWKRDQPRIWNDLIHNIPIIRERLGDLFLQLVLDDEIGVAYIQQCDPEDLEVPKLLRRNTYTLSDSVLLVDMRERLMRAMPAGERATISTDEIFSLLAFYDSGSRKDEATFKSRVNATIKRLKEKHLLIALGRESNSHSYEVSPVLRMVFDAEEIKRLKDSYEKLLDKQAAFIDKSEENK